MAKLATPAESPSGSATATPREAWSWIGCAVATLLLTIWFYSPVRTLAPPTLDGSNFASFAYFTAKGFQYGEDVFHVGGPLGFIQYGFVYAGHLFSKRLPLEILVKLVVALLALDFVRASGRTAWRWVWLAILIVLVPLVEDLTYDLAILLAGLALLRFSTGTRRIDYTLSAALGAFLALMTLVKGTHAVLGLATLAVALAHAWVQSRRTSSTGKGTGAVVRPFIPAAAYLVGLVLFLVLAGQNPLNFPAYLQSVLQQSSGYNKAMVLDEPRAVFLVGLAAVVVLMAMVAATAWRRWRSPHAIATACLLAGFCFVEWKHGFVRADGHVYIFFHFAMLAGFTIHLAAHQGEGGRSGWLRPALLTGAFVTLGLGIWADGPQALWRYRWAAEDTPERLKLTFEQLLAPGRAKEKLDAEFTGFRRRYDLPVIRDRVGNDPIDFFGIEHGYLTLNRLNYRPRPMGGGNFSVFNAWLQDRNFEFVADDARAPRWFLVGLEMFDHRLVAQEDAGTLRAILAKYRPVATEQGMVLLERMERGSIPEPQLLSERSFTLDETIPLPDPGAGRLLAVRLEAPFNLAGTLRMLAYKAPLLFLSMDGDGLLHPHSRRVIPAMFERPVVLGPVIEDTRDFLQIFGPAPGKRLRTARFHTAKPGLYDTPAFRIQFFAIPRPTADAGVIAQLSRELAFPVAKRVPLRWSPPNAPLRRFDALLVQMLEPPGRIEFAATAKDNTVAFAYGIDPAAYLGKGGTDGVEFIVELHRPGNPPQVVFNRWLRPRSVPADQGFQFARVVLPPQSRSGNATLALRTEPGTDGDGAWDWAFFSGINITGDGYAAGQFPGISLLPVEIEYASGGALPHEGRTIFMLNAPGSLTFEPAGARKLALSAGLLPGAYTKGGESDGVTFAVYAEEGGQRRPIFSYHANPRENSADRGTCHFTIDLPKLAAGARIIVRTEPGPNGNAAWDWSYIESLHFQ